MSEVYSSVDAVITYSGATPDAMGMRDTAELKATLLVWLQQAKDFIDRDRNRDFHEEASVPPAIDNIAMRMVGNLVRMAERQRNRSVVGVDGGNVLQIDDHKMFTPAILADLHCIPAAPSVRMVVHHGNST